MSDINRIDIAEFRKLGFLQEANRQFFHPLGLALEVVVEDECRICNGTGRGPVSSACERCEGSGKRPEDQIVERLGGVWDYRDDPEGMVYGSGELDVDKIAAVAAERARHTDARIALLRANRIVQEPGDEGL